jgi:hypothetical protein
MADWVQCSSISDPPTPVFVNLDQVISLRPVNLGTAVVYAGGDVASFVVSESPERILMLKALRRG